MARRKTWRRTQRLTTLVVLLVCLGVGTAFVLSALRKNIVFFLVPSDVQAHTTDGSLEGRRLRMGGLVVEGSVVRDPDSGEVRFVITDGAARVAVRYRGLLPDLFREGQGIVAMGEMVASKEVKNISKPSARPLPILNAEQILAKHDEYYMPRGLEKALKKRNLWREQP